ncbi:hypothetical protein FA95DRAFT_1567290 [Auriscalpium vulgare]|uniref:Uncharacterized protein n=1 Tax=Auriscalpium vulgare TaxID=40419 RepID=A0ACB8R5D5_9AGAM|nr:hypothetical protein FA95DRAFT_1567290 [Auriscalpium vulgare]
MMTNNGSSDDGETRTLYQDALSSLEWQLGNFSAWLNGTEASNFTLPVRPIAEDNMMSTLLPLKGVLDPSHNSYFVNVTGFIRGSATLYNISAAALNSTAHAELPWEADAVSLMQGVNATDSIERLGSWNWTAVEKVSMSVMEKPVEDPDTMEGLRDIVTVHGHVELIDANSADELRLEFEGVRFLKNGTIYGLAEPQSAIIDVRALPALVPPPALNLTAHALLPTLRSRVSNLRALLASSDFSSNDAALNREPDVSATGCTFAVRAQLAPSNISATDMEELEEELVHPTGVSTVARPRLVLDAVLLSRECGLVIKVEEAEGLRSRLFFRKVTTYAGFSGCIYLFLLILLSYQMGQSRTPAALASISRWTFLAQSMADSISFAGHITFAVLADGRPSLSLVMPAFLSCTLFAYEVQFALLIQQVQAPEDAAPPPPSPPPATAPPPDEPLEPTSATPLTQAASPPPFDAISGGAPPAAAPAAAIPPVPTPTTPPPTPSFFRLFLEHIRSDSQARTWMMLFFVLTFVVRIVLAPALALLFFALLYGALWAPQIVRASRRLRTCALSWQYMLGTTAGRFLLALYFLGCPANVLDVEPRGWVYFLGLFMLLQLGVLALQEKLGPAFFLPTDYSRPKAYDYHPPLPPQSDPEARGALGDCAICMDAIVYETDGDEKLHSEPGAVSIFGVGLPRKSRKNYSLSPCGHLFHTECLERWLAIKNICPQCRRPLPPL